MLSRATEIERADKEGMFFKQVKWDERSGLDVLALPGDLEEWVDMVHAAGAEGSAGTEGMEGMRSKGSEMYKKGVVGRAHDETKRDDMQDNGGS